MTFEHTPKPKSSPWGRVDLATEIADGIWFVSTTSHGGFLVSDERLAAMPKELRKLGSSDSPFHGTRGAFEEDVEAPAVVVAFPLEFTSGEVARAQGGVDWLRN